MIEAECQYRNGNRWSRTYSGDASLGASGNNHAERVAYAHATRTSGNADTYRIRLNAFPCVSCTAFFLKESKSGRRIILDCTANEGSYAKECGFLTDPFIQKARSTTMEQEIKGALYFVNGKVLAKHKRIKVLNEGSGAVSFEGTNVTGGYQRDDGVTDELVRLRNS